MGLAGCKYRFTTHTADLVTASVLLTSVCVSLTADCMTLSVTQATCIERYVQPTPAPSLGDWKDLRTQVVDAGQGTLQCAAQCFNSRLLGTGTGLTCFALRCCVSVGCVQITRNGSSMEHTGAAATYI